MIKGIKTSTKGASFVEDNARRQGSIEKEFKLRELAKILEAQDKSLLFSLQIFFHVFANQIMKIIN
jgi:hypothetical protein